MMAVSMHWCLRPVQSYGDRDSYRSDSDGHGLARSEIRVRATATGIIIMMDSDVDSQVTFSHFDSARVQGTGWPIGGRPDPGPPQPGPGSGPTRDSGGELEIITRFQT